MLIGWMSSGRRPLRSLRPKLGWMYIRKTASGKLSRFCLRRFTRINTNKKALIIQRFFLLVVRQEQFQQRVEEQFALLGDLPVLRGFFQIAFGQRFVQLRANDAFR